MLYAQASCPCGQATHDMGALLKMCPQLTELTIRSCGNLDLGLCLASPVLPCLKTVRIGKLKWSLPDVDHAFFLSFLREADVNALKNRYRGVSWEITRIHIDRCDPESFAEMDQSVRPKVRYIEVGDMVYPIVLRRIAREFPYAQLIYFDRERMEREQLTTACPGILLLNVLYSIFAVYTVLAGGSSWYTGSLSPSPASGNLIFTGFTVWFSGSCWYMGRVFSGPSFRIAWLCWAFMHCIRGSKYITTHTKSDRKALVQDIGFCAILALSPVSNEFLFLIIFVYYMGIIIFFYFLLYIALSIIFPQRRY